mmetsp:Transcript_28512/g.43759  ORF Transcript_28512/g.43759 Transcript_28512/m.43759 type:complete len:139 (-) Transcript_28512:180-596(-)
MIRKAIIFMILVCSHVGSAFVLPISPRLVQSHNGNANNPLPAFLERRTMTTTTIQPRWSNNVSLEAFKRNQQPPQPPQDEEDSGNKFLNTLKEKPGTLIILPFVAIFGLDLILNIAVVTKRSLEFVLLGETPNADPWW